MNRQLQARSRQYAAILRRYLQGEPEAVLEEAYELGRAAIGEGLGVLDMARVHQQVMASCVFPALQAANKARTLQAAETFFLETLSHFEATHRGFREANLALQELNDMLERRNEELALINRQLRHSEESLRCLSNQVLHAQEEERKRISRELHDEVGQALTAVSTQLAILRGNGVAGTDQFKQRITDAQNLVGQTMETVHRFARELRPAMLDELGLVPALRTYLKAFADRTGLRVRFSPDPSAEKLDDEQRIVLFRVAQESLTNVAKHARATQATVRLSRLRQGVRMQVKDNGRAFEAAPPGNRNGSKRLGLLGMQERVRLVNGRFSIRSMPGKGTTVSVEIPFKKTG
jgi:signal transduction histidine kinase